MNEETINQEDESRKETTISEEKNYVGRSLEDNPSSEIFNAENIVKNEGKINNQNNYFVHSKDNEDNTLKITYGDLCETSFSNNFVKENDIYSTIIKSWELKRVLVISTPSYKVADAAIEILRNEFSNKKWHLFDFQGKNSTVKESRNLSDYGTDIFTQSNITNLREKVWVLKLHRSDEINKQTFLEKVFKTDRWHGLTDITNQCKNTESLTIWQITDTETSQTFIKLYQEYSQDIEEHICYWPVDFLPTFLHIHFGGNGDLNSDNEANYFIDVIRNQQEKGLWAKGEFEFYKEISRFFQTNQGGKAEFRRYVKKLEAELQQKTAYQIIAEKQVIAQELVSTANPVEKIILYLVSTLEEITVSDFRLLMDYLLSDDIKVNEEKQEEYYDEENKIRKRNIETETLGSKYFKIHSSNILKNYHIEIFQDEEKDNLLSFKDSRLKEDVRNYFQNIDPIYSQNQFEKILEFAESGLIYFVLVSETLSRSIIKLIAQMSNTDINKYGVRALASMLNRIQKLTIDKNKELKDMSTINEEVTDFKIFRNSIEKIKENHQCFDEKIAYARLAELIEEMLESGSSRLEDLIKIQLLKPLAMDPYNEFSTRVLFSLLKRLDHLSAIDPLDYLKHVFNSSRLRETREKALNYLISVSYGQGFGLPSILKKIAEWIPNEKYNEYHQANTKRVGVIFLFVLADKLIQEKGINEETVGKWPSNYPLFRNLPQDIQERDNILKLYVDWLYHPGLLDALGHWIFQEHNALLWENRYNSGFIPRGSVDVLNLVFCKFQVSNDLPVNIDKNTFLSLILNFVIEQERSKIFEIWMLILIGKDSKNIHPEASEIVHKLLFFLFKKTDKKEHSSIIKNWQNQAELLLKLAGNESYSRAERRLFSLRSKVFYYLIKQFKHSKK